MLSVYVPRGTCLERIPVTSDADVPENAVWFDLVNPTLQEDKIVERQVGIAVPTREEMQEIEVTSRLYGAVSAGRGFSCHAFFRARSGR